MTNRTSVLIETLLSNHAQWRKREQYGGGKRAWAEFEAGVANHFPAFVAKYQRMEADVIAARERMGQEIERARIAGDPVSKAMIVSHRALGDALAFDPLTP